MNFGQVFVFLAPLSYHGQVTVDDLVVQPPFPLQRAKAFTPDPPKRLTWRGFKGLLDSGLHAESQLWQFRSLAVVTCVMGNVFQDPSSFGSRSRVDDGCNKISDFWKNEKEILDFLEIGTAKKQCFKGTGMGRVEMRRNFYLPLLLVVGAESMTTEVTISRLRQKNVAF